MPKELFGTDGIRGTPGTFPLDDATLYWTGRALADYLREATAAPRILIGTDTRESGRHIAEQIARGARDAGLECAFAGVITTPGVASLVRQNGFSAGVVISASHNPWTDNGVKLFAGTGMKFPDAVEAQIEAQILASASQPVNAPAIKLTADAKIDEAYLTFLHGRLLPGAKLAGMRMVLDCANGAASALAPELFGELGADVIAIHHRPDGRNINDGCGSLHPESMRKKVVQSNAALGVAFDGDADRAIFSTATGKLVDGDGVLLAMARWMKAAGVLKGGGVVGTTMANLGLEKALAAEGLTLAREPVGDRYVLEGMQRIGANLGGEQSGHIIFLDDAPTGDGMLTALKIASLVALEGPLEELVRGLRVFPQTIVNVRVRSKPPLESLPEVARALAEANRALDGAGRVVLRYSGTEQLARVMVEAEQQQDVDRWSAAIANAIRSSIGVT